MFKGQFKGFLDWKEILRPLHKARCEKRNLLWRSICNMFRSLTNVIWLLWLNMFCIQKHELKNEGRAVENILLCIDTKTQGLIEIPIASDHKMLQVCKVPSLLFGQINVDSSWRVIWSIVGVVCPAQAWSFGVDKACSSSSQFVCLFLAWMCWDAKLGMFCFPLLFMRSGWGTQCVYVAVGWPVIYFIHVSSCLEAGFKWFCWFWCCFRIFIALSGNWNYVEIFWGRSLWLIAMNPRVWSSRLQFCCG